ncbi:MAG: hypothetical protein ABJL54_15985 [Halioglobus sp.]
MINLITFCTDHFLIKNQRFRALRTGKLVWATAEGHQQIKPKHLETPPEPVILNTPNGTVNQQQSRLPTK